MPNPVVAHINYFDDFEVMVLRWTIQEAVESGQKDLPIVITSNGGEIYCLNAMADMLEESGLNIHTISLGKSFSCGAALFAIGKNRHMGKRSTLVLHQLQGGVGGTNADIQSAAKECSRLTAGIFEMMDKSCGKEPGFYENLVKDNGNTELYLSPEQALEYGLATNIGLPKVNDMFPDKAFVPPDYEQDDTMKVLMAFNSLDNPNIKAKKEFYLKKKNFNFKEELTQMPMTREQYLARIRAVANKSIATMSFEVFNTIPDAAQTEYLSTLDRTDKDLPVGNILSTIPADVIKPDLASQLAFDAKLTELESKFTNVTEQLKQSNLDRINILESGIKNNAKVEAVSKALFTLTNAKTPDGKVGSRIPENTRKTVEFNLANADNEKKFAHPEKPEIQVTQFDMLVESYSNQPIINMTVQGSLLENKDPNNVSVTLDDFTSTQNVGTPTNEEVKSMQVLKVAKDYAAKNGLNFDSKEGRTKAIAEARSLVYAGK